MRVIIAGSRNCESYDDLLKAIDLSGFAPDIILSGCCRGVDLLGERWAKENSLPVERHPAEWKKYGKLAGPRRNMEMATKADALIALWDSKSRGTRNMIQLAKDNGLMVYVHHTPEVEEAAGLMRDPGHKD